MRDELSLLITILIMVVLVISDTAVHLRGTLAQRALDARGAREWGRVRRSRTGALAPLAAQEERFQSGRAAGARRSPEDKLTRIGYTRSRAQHAGSGRALGRREAGERPSDDVFTTGATLGAGAGTLLEAGAGEVHALSLCRTV